MTKVEYFLGRYEAPILLLLLVSVLLVNSQGLSWGLPAFWNTDEIATSVIPSLNGPVDFNQTNFDYPSLPKYVMLFIGRITDLLGYPRTSFILVSRFCSVFLGAITIWLAYALVKAAGGKRFSALLAALFTATSSELSLNSHFAHNDLYVTFFVGLTVILAIKYLYTDNKTWLYASFFATGLAASSKYNGGAVILTSILAHLLLQKRSIWLHKIQTFETAFVGAGLSFLGFALGTPTALTSSAFYIKRLLPALWRHANYNRTPASLPGIIRQWSIMEKTFGNLLLILFLATFLFFLFFFILSVYKRQLRSHLHIHPALLIMSAIIALDLPILVSYNLHQRFFLPLLPLFSALAGLAIEEIHNWLRRYNKPLIQNLTFAAIMLIVLFTGLRVVSVILSIKHDARIPAAEYIETLPPQATYEVTMYGPNFKEDQYQHILIYPMVFLKFPGQEPPKDRFLDYNSGEKGIEERKPDYFIASSFIYNRFANEYICQLHQAECDFFKRLLNGQTNYQEIAHFSYRPPWFLPNIQLDFINPEIRIYQRNAK